MKFRSNLVTGFLAGFLAVFGLACEVEEGAGEELIPENATEAESG
jgi:hypothetical protein